ncbi:MAG: hypothetical protein AB7S75_03340 [Desulfococcaceae bacterium]
MFQAVIGFLGVFATRYLGIFLVGLAVKKFLYLLFATVIMPVVLFRVWLEVQTFFMELIQTEIQRMISQGTYSPQSVSLLGFGAFLGDCFRLPQCLAVLLSFLMVSFSIRMIKR